MAATKNLIDSLENGEIPYVCGGERGTFRVLDASNVVLEGGKGCINGVISIPEFTGMLMRDERKLPQAIAPFLKMLWPYLLGLEVPEDKTTAGIVSALRSRMIQTSQKNGYDLGYGKNASPEWRYVPLADTSDVPEGTIRLSAEAAAEGFVPVKDEEIPPEWREVVFENEADKDTAFAVSAEESDTAEEPVTVKTEAPAVTAEEPVEAEQEAPEEVEASPVEETPVVSEAEEPAAEEPEQPAETEKPVEVTAPAAAEPAAEAKPAAEQKTAPAKAEGENTFTATLLKGTLKEYHGLYFASAKTADGAKTHVIFTSKVNKDVFSTEAFSYIKENLEKEDITMNFLAVRGKKGFYFVNGEIPNEPAASETASAEKSAPAEARDFFTGPVMTTGELVKKGDHYEVPVIADNKALTLVFTEEGVTKMGSMWKPFSKVAADRTVLTIKAECTDDAHLTFVERTSAQQADA